MKICECGKCGNVWRPDIYGEQCPICFPSREGATEGRPAGFASSSGSASAASDVQSPPVAAEPAANPKPSNMGKEEGALDLSRAVQLPVSGLAASVDELIEYWSAIRAGTIVPLSIYLRDEKNNRELFGLVIRLNRVQYLKEAASAPSGAGASGGS